MSTKQLFVLRHAKSSWDDPGLDDHERPLAQRGRRAVKVLAEHLQKQGIKPGQVLCSPARRTVETLEGVGLDGEALIEGKLYTATGSEIIERLRQIPEEVDSVMVIGHNPAMQMLVLRLASTAVGAREGSNLADVERKFPTGALATLTFDCAWGELGPGRAELTALVRPKDLH
jgi:phosphohistidine phosphatase